MNASQQNQVVEAPLVSYNVSVLPSGAMGDTNHNAAMEQLIAAWQKSAKQGYGDEIDWRWIQRHEHLHSIDELVQARLLTEENTFEVSRRRHPTLDATDPIADEQPSSDRSSWDLLLIDLLGSLLSRPEVRTPKTGKLSEQFVRATWMVTESCGQNEIVRETRLPDDVVLQLRECWALWLKEVRHRQGIIEAAVGNGDWERRATQAATPSVKGDPADRGCDPRGMPAPVSGIDLRLENLRFLNRERTEKDCPPCWRCLYFDGFLRKPGAVEPRVSISDAEVLVAVTNIEGRKEVIARDVELALDPFRPERKRLARQRRKVEQKKAREEKAAGRAVINPHEPAANDSTECTEEAA